MKDVKTKFTIIEGATCYLVMYGSTVIKTCSTKEEAQRFADELNVINEVLHDIHKPKK